MATTPSASSATPLDTTDAADSISNTTLPFLPPVMGRWERGEEIPHCLIFVGMAGSGKTTLLTALQRYLEDNHENQRDSDEKRGAAAPSEAV